MNIDTAEMLHGLREEIRGLASPWMTRKQAAAYLRTSESTIDALADKRGLPRKYLAGSPRFHRNDLDALVSNKKDGLKEERRVA